MATRQGDGGRGRWLHALLARAARGRRLGLASGLLAAFGTGTASYPVTAIIVPATLLVPRRWRSVALAAALGSAIAATALVAVFHFLGWAWVFGHFPQIAGNPTWAQVMEWADRYGAAALFVVAVSPLPQTPALIVLGAARHEYLSVFAAMLAGKAIKYLVVAWMAQWIPTRLEGRWPRWLPKAWRNVRPVANGDGGASQERDVMAGAHPAGGQIPPP
ncbi:MAG: hypothetical protein JNJ44_05585 [Zoogloeaceae bacterium]|nr:hypothetical protein [Zoogloeaceae bacterium]